MAFMAARNDDVYVYGSENGGENANWTLSEDQIRILKPLSGATGRFADLKLGQLTKKGGKKKTVVVKMNKGKNFNDFCS